MPTEWIDPTDEIEPDFPMRAASIQRIQANITALAEGAEGAPPITRAALVALGYVGLRNGSRTSLSTTYATVTSYGASVSGGGATVSDGSVTVPRAGIYLVAWSATLNRWNDDNVKARIQANAADLTTPYILEVDGNHQVSETFLVSLAADAVIRVQGACSGVISGASLKQVCLTVQEQG